MSREPEHCSPTVAIIGAGPLGRWLALSAARAGLRVFLEDVMPTNLHHAREALRQQLNLDLRQDGEHALPGNTVAVTFVSSIEEAVRDADLVIDCVPDELESKLEILWLLDRMAPPRTVFATPTTRLSISDLASCTYRPGQCIAIASEASSLAAGGSFEILLRTTPHTTPQAVVLLNTFWRRLGFMPTFALENPTCAGN